MNKFTFFVKVSLVGPYVPEDKTVVEDYVIKSERVEITDWEQRVTELNADPSPGSALLSLVKKINTKEANSIILKIITDTPSSKVAFNQAEKIMVNLASLMTLCVHGNRYYYKIEAVKMQPLDEFSMPFESAPSDDFFAVDYVKKQIDQTQIDYVKYASAVISKNPLMQKVLEVFGKALSAELENGVGDEKSILGYYKCIELISQNESKVKNKDLQQQKDDYQKLVNKVKKSIVKETDLKKSIAILRKAGQTLREIENSLISKNIEETAKKIGFNNDGIIMLRQVIKIRNKVIVHSDSEVGEIASGFDLRHFRECAKAFIKLYLSQKFGVDYKGIDKLPQQKEIARTYRITYRNSVLGNKAEEKLAVNSKK